MNKLSIQEVEGNNKQIEKKREKEFSKDTGVCVNQLQK